MVLLIQRSISGSQSVNKVEPPQVSITGKRMREPSLTKTPLKSAKKKKTHQSFARRNITFDDFGGDTKVLEEVCKLILHISHPEIYSGIGVTPPRGFLLHGPPGCGKTLLANAIAGELEVELIQVSSFFSQT